MRSSFLAQLVQRLLLHQLLDQFVTFVALAMSAGDARHRAPAGAARSSALHLGERARRLLRVARQQRVRMGLGFAFGGAVGLVGHGGSRSGRPHCRPAPDHPKAR
jgi:hypothetical protein